MRLEIGIRKAPEEEAGLQTFIEHLYHIRSLALRS